MYREHIGWTSSKLIAWIISLGLRYSEPQHRQSSPRETPQNSGGIEVGRCSEQKIRSISEAGQDMAKVTNDDQ